MNNETDITWVNFVRVVATFLVICLHSAAPLLYRYGKISDFNWWVGNVYDSMVRMSVPLFFMISGYLLIDKTEKIQTFFKKRVQKVVIPMIAWSIIYIFWKAYVEHSGSLTLNSFYRILLEPSYYHLWFLHAIVGIYLYLPILRVFVNNSNPTYLYYFVVLWLVAVSIIPYIERATGVVSRFDLKMISGYVGYLVIGHLLGRRYITNKAIYYSIIGYAICFLITSCGTYLLTSTHEKFDGLLYRYLSPNVVILSISSFILLKSFSEKSPFLNSPFIVRIVNSISSASLGIYLIHTMFLYVISSGLLGYRLNVTINNPIWAIPLMTIIVFSMSFMSVYILQKIPFVRKIVP